MKFKKFLTVLSLAPIVIVFVNSFFENRSANLLIQFVIATTIFILINFSQVRELSISATGLNLKKEIEAAKELNEKAAATLEQLNSVAVPLLRFNTAILNKDGEFDNVTDFEDIISFIDSCHELKSHLSIASPEIETNLRKSYIKAVMSFAYKVNIEYKVSLSNLGLIKIKGDTIYDIPEVISIDLVGIANISDDLVFQKLYSKFEKFVNKYLHEKVKEG
ncbi:hypothetical protein HCC60_02875 [Streptococcus suis]|nr:hypothetical protein [Streptococcus suis]